MLGGCAVTGQTDKSAERPEEKYKGTWYNQAENHYMDFHFEKETNIVTINEWAGNRHKNKSNSMDADKAILKGDTIVMNAQNSGIQAPYCEIVLMNESLIYFCNDALNHTDNKRVNSNAFTELVFKKLK